MSKSLLTDADANSTFTVTATYSETMDNTVAPTIVFSPTVNSSLSFTSGSWNGAHTIYTASYTVADANVAVNNVALTVSGGRDVAGNLQSSFTQNSAFSIDTLNPTVQSVAVSKTLLTDADASSTFMVAVTYSETMDNAVTPTVAFTPTVNTTLAFASGSWNGHTIYTASYTLADGNVAVNNVAITVSAGKDANGNAQTDAFTQNNAFSIDTLNPTVQSVAVSKALLSDADASSTFTVAATFAEPMDNSVAPTIAFSPTVNSSLGFASGSWNGARTIYTANYTVADANLTVNNVAITVSGGKDAHGNAQTDAFTQTSGFSIDTLNPTVQSVTVSKTPLTDADSTFTVAATYSEPMDHAVAPTVVFSSTVNSSLSFTSGSWNGAHTIYTANYTVTDANVTVNNVAITVSAGRDAAGNLQAGFTQNNAFSIDTLNPTVQSVAVSKALLTDADAADAFTVTATYSEAMDIAIAPTIAFSPAVNSSLSFTSGSWNGAHTVYTASYTVVDGNVAADNISITVSGGRDAAGNLQTSFTQSNAFSIDTFNPTVQSVVVSKTVLTDADAAGTFTVTTTYGEAMDNTVAPTIAFSPTVNSSLGFTSGSWNGAHTIYTANYTVTDANVAVNNVAITISAGKDAHGNAQTASFTQSNAFSIDTLNPTVQSVTVSKSLLADPDVNSTFTVTTTYGEIMDDAATPTIAFSPTVNSTLTFNSGSWNGAHTVYTGSYTVGDANVTVYNIAITVTGGRDAHGNAQTNAFTQSSAFSIDTFNPTVQSVAISKALLVDADAGGAFTVAATYSKAMDNSAAPTIAFSPTVSSSLSLTSGNWNGTHTIYTASYAIADANVDHQQYCDHGRPAAAMPRAICKPVSRRTTPSASTRSIRLCKP